MTYWNNDLIELTWPNARDPVQESFHNGEHLLFWNPEYDFKAVRTNQTLNDLCAWANQQLEQGLDEFVANPYNHYDIANLVKLNMWIHDIQLQGIVKPWLILDLGDGSCLAGTGDSRLRCLTVLPEITHVRAFISTHRDRAHLYTNLTSVTSFDQFAELCGAQPGQNFLFRLTDHAAPYGLYWYEYNSERTRAVTPRESWCVDRFQRYAKLNPDLKITPHWFATLKPWADF